MKSMIFIDSKCTLLHRFVYRVFPCSSPVISAVMKTHIPVVDRNFFHTRFDQLPGSETSEYDGGKRRGRGTKPELAHARLPDLPYGDQQSLESNTRYFERIIIIAGR